MSKPVAVILAAGKGTRMQSDLPKVLCRVCDRPMVEYVVETLQAAGVGRMICVIGYRAELVRSTLSKYESVEFVEQTEQLGTGHAVMVCRDSLQSHDGPVVVVAGDSPMLQKDSLQTLLKEFEREKPACILGTLMKENPTGLGRIVRDSQGSFAGIVEEKDATELQKRIKEVNMSTYVFDCHELLNALLQLSNDNRQREYYLTDIPGIFVRGKKRVLALPVLKRCEALSVNTVEELKIVEAEMIKLNS